jgi:fatty acid desaturase
MKIEKNEGSIDRLIRIIFAEIFFLLAFFWLGGITQIIFYILGVALLLTGIFGFCGAYTLIGLKTCSVTEKPLSRRAWIIFALLFLAILIGGGYASHFFTK